MLLSCLAAVVAGAWAQTPAAPSISRGPQTVRRVQPAGRSGIAITVTDPRGRTLRGISVELTGPATRAGETDTSGQINFPGLPAGTYRVRFTGEEVVEFEREVTLRAGQVATLDVTLTPAPSPPAPKPAEDPPVPPPAPAAPLLGPAGAPQAVSIVQLVERELIGDNDARKDTLLACSGNTRTTLVQLNQPQARRVYEGAEALYYVIAGEGTFSVDGRTAQLQAAGFVSVPRGVAHSIERRGRRPLILLAVLSGEPCEQAK
jgi:hypothetical protein